MTDPEADARLYRNARREARTVTLVWAAALLWSVGYCYLNGYRHDPDDWVVTAGLATADPDPAVLLGFPDWVFWGILVPWVLCSAYTIYFGLVGIADDPLGRESDEGGGHGH